MGLCSWYAGGLRLPVCQDSKLAERRTARNPQRTESVVVRHCRPVGERDLVRGW